MRPKLSYMGLKLTYMGLKLTYMGPKLTYTGLRMNHMRLKNSREPDIVQRKRSQEDKKKKWRVGQSPDRKGE